MYYLCDKKIIPTFANERLTFKGDVIADSCKSSPEDLYLYMIVADISPEIHSDIRIEYSV